MLRDRSERPTDHAEPTAWPALGADQVHVWRASLALDREASRRALATLCGEERRRAERLVEVPARRFIAARAGLRAVLGRYLGLAPRDVPLTRTARGKPELDPRAGPDWLTFSVTHSADLALYATAFRRPVGVDVERLRSDLDPTRLAERFFSALEQADLDAVPAPLRRHAFFDAWTRKEAYLKARGLGLTLPLGRFSVSLAPGAPAALLVPPEDEPGPVRWWLTDIDAGPDYAAALAVAGVRPIVRLADGPAL